jgi:ABC-type nitrate/sulfonate/bicarbonate transport system, permease component
MTIKNTGVPVDDPERPTPDGDEQAVTAVRGRRVRSVLWGTVPVLTFVVLLGAWALAVRLFKIPQYLLPGPEDVLPRIGEDWTSLWQNSVVTIKEILFGFGLTIVTAIPLGLLIALSAVGRRLVYPLLVFIQLVPKIAIAPLFLVWFGFGMSSKVVLTLLMTFFPLLLASISGFQILDQRLLYLTRSMGAGRWQTFRYLRFPSALPVIFSGLKTAATIAATAAIVAEFVGANEGLGYQLLQGTSTLDTELIFVVLLLLTLIGVALNYIVEFLEYILTPWQRKENQ